MKKITSIFLLIIVFACTDETPNLLEKEIASFITSDVVKKLQIDNETIDFMTYTNYPHPSLEDTQVFRVYLTKSNEILLGFRKESEEYFFFATKIEINSNEQTLDQINRSYEQHQKFSGSWKFNMINGDIIKYDLSDDIITNTQLQQKNKIPHQEQNEECENATHVGQCAAESIEGDGVVERIACYVTILECLAIKAIDCLIDGCEGTDYVEH